MEKSNVNPMEVLRTKDPAMYKAAAMAGVAYFDDEGIVEAFLDEVTSYINKCSKSIEDGGSVTLMFPIPKECKEFESEQFS